MHKYSHLNQDLVWKAVMAISTGDLLSLSDAVTSSQQLFNDCAVPNCPSQHTAPKLNMTIQHPSLRSLYLAAKGVGSQGDGSVQFLCRSSEEQSNLLKILTSEEWGYDAFPLTIAPSLALSADSALNQKRYSSSSFVLMH